jgi:hypothetical protein
LCFREPLQFIRTFQTFNWLPHFLIEVHFVLLGSSRQLEIKAHIRDNTASIEIGVDCEHLKSNGSYSWANGSDVRAFVEAVVNALKIRETATQATSVDQLKPVSKTEMDFLL